MRVRVCGQLSLADGLVRAPENGVLDQIASAVDWAALDVVLRSLRNRRSDAGAPGYPPVLLLRCLLLGVWHGGLSDPALEAALADRLSFRRFVGLSLDDPTPDHSTLWRFRAALQESGLAEAVFAEINRQFEAKGLIVKQGTLIDASLVRARARPSRRSRRGDERPSADPDAAWGGKECAQGVRLQDPHRGRPGAYTDPHRGGERRLGDRHRTERPTGVRGRGDGAGRPGVQQQGPPRVVEGAWHPRRHHDAAQQAPPGLGALAQATQPPSGPGPLRRVQGAVRLALHALFHPSAQSCAGPARLLRLQPAPCRRRWGG